MVPATETVPLYRVGHAPPANTSAGAAPAAAAAVAATELTTVASLEQAASRTSPIATGATPPVLERTGPA